MLVEDIKASNSAFRNNPTVLTEDEKELKKIEKSCEDLAVRLETKIRKLSVPEDSRLRLLKSAQVSARVVWKGKDIQLLKQRLLDIQSHLQQRIVAIVARSQISGLLSNVQGLHDQNARIEIATHTKLDQLAADLMKLTGGAQSQSLDQHQYLSNPVDRIKTTVIVAKQAMKNEQIIGSLWFHMLKDRYDGIGSAYHSTLQWLFDPQKTNLSEWLRDGNGIFWVNGQVSLRILWVGSGTVLIPR